MVDPDRTASLMSPTKLAQAARAVQAASPSAWLDQMAADAGYLHVRRLEELRGVLQTHARAREPASLAAVMEQLAARLPQLEFESLSERGWWARTTGKTREAAAAFADCFSDIEETARELASQLQSRAKRGVSETQATDRALLEIEVEFRAIDKIVEQASRWLQDMRNQLQSRQASPGDEQAQRQIKEDTARCDILVERLTRLRAVSAAAQQTHTQVREAAAARAALEERLQQKLAGELKAWHAGISRLASSAADGQAPALSLEGPIEAQRALQKRLPKLLQRLAALKAQEEALAAALVEFGRRLEAVR